MTTTPDSVGAMYSPETVAFLRGELEFWRREALRLSACLRDVHDALGVANSAPAVHVIPVPPEPPVGTVFVNRHSVAGSVDWRRDEDGWRTDVYTHARGGVVPWAYASRSMWGHPRRILPGDVKEVEVSDQ